MNEEKERSILTPKLISAAPSRHNLGLLTLQSSSYSQSKASPSCFSARFVRSDRVIDASFESTDLEILPQTLSRTVEHGKFD